MHSSSFTQAHVRATHHRRDVGAAAGADAGQTPDMPPLRSAHASGPPEANAPRATYRVATPCTGPPSGRVGWAFTHTRRGGPASAVASSPLPRRHIMHLPSGSRASRAWFLVGPQPPYVAPSRRAYRVRWLPSQPSRPTDSALITRRHVGNAASRVGCSSQGRLPSPISGWREPNRPGT